MAKNLELEKRLEEWARWYVMGCNANYGGGFDSFIHMMMTTRCEFSGGGGPRNDAMESKIENAVSLLTAQDQKAAVVLRVEYGARELRSLDTSRSTQLDKAHSLKMTTITYRRSLDRAKLFVARKIGLEYQPIYLPVSSPKKGAKGSSTVNQMAYK